MRHGSPFEAFHCLAKIHVAQIKTVPASFLKPGACPTALLRPLRLSSRSSLPLTAGPGATISFRREGKLGRWVLQAGSSRPC